jgi:hypothetical protein
MGRTIRVRSFLVTLAIEAVTMEAASKAIPRLLNILVNAVTGATPSEPVQATTPLLQRPGAERRRAGT